MPRYFCEVAYKGTNYNGFQVQDNGRSIQAEVERALETFYRGAFELTGSSRTDTGVHAMQNYFHFDYEGVISDRHVYNINAILPGDVVIKRIFEVAGDAHCRFDAVAREYRYYIYKEKDPWLAERAWFFPYTMDRGLLDEAARRVKMNTDFRAFSKRNTQVKTYRCRVDESGWTEDEKGLVYRVVANRFLRGMVRGLVATMLQVGRGRIGLDEFSDILVSGENQRVDFSAPGHGLFLFRVYMPDSILSFPVGSER